jgi:hypothetical protein
MTQKIISPWIKIEKGGKLPNDNEEVFLCVKSNTEKSTRKQYEKGTFYSAVCDRLRRQEEDYFKTLGGYILYVSSIISDNDFFNYWMSIPSLPK